MSPRTFSLTVLAYLLLTPIAWGQERWSRESLMRIPETSSIGVVPRLEIEWSESNPKIFYMCVKLYTQRRARLFNPFGNAHLGCPYFIVISDSDGVPLFQVMKVLPANESVPSPDAWIFVPESRVIGRRFARNRDFTLNSLDVEPTPEVSLLKEGDYLLHLLVTRRVVSDQLFDGQRGVSSTQAEWHGDKLDKVVCRAPAVRIQVDRDGNVQRPAKTPVEPQAAIRVNTAIRKSSLDVEAIIVSRDKHVCSNVGLLEVSANCGIHVSPPAHVDRKPWVRLGRSYSRSEASIQKVPKDIILGYVYSNPVPLAAGKYEISVNFPSDLWMEPNATELPTKTTVELAVTEERIQKAQSE